MVYMQVYGFAIKQTWDLIYIGSLNWTCICTDCLTCYIQEKNLRAMALDCLHRVVRFYLNVYADTQPKNRVWDYLHSVTSQLLVLLKKGSLTQDSQHDKVVEFCLTIAESNLDFAMNHMILELLRNDNPSEAKVIGLRALLAVVSSPSHHRRGSDAFKSDDIHYTTTSSLQGSPLSPWSSSGYLASSVRLPFSAQTSASTFSEACHDISQYIPKVRAALDQIIRTCHSTYGSARLTSPKATLGISRLLVFDKSKIVPRLKGQGAFYVTDVLNGRTYKRETARVDGF